jgi:hypothetical protein
MHQVAKTQMRNDMYQKMVDCRDFGDLTIVLDASGGAATVYHPHFISHSKNENQRHSQLKVHIYMQ